MKLEYKMEKGIVEVKFEMQADLDKDGKPSMKATSVVELSAYELVNEIAKKDIAFLEALLSQVKLGK